MNVLKPQANNMLRYNFSEGEVLLIDKPYGWTSFDVVNKIRYAIKIKKIGHAGTLDPLATGLLILCTGKKTKSIHQYQAQEKEYEGKLILGQTRPSIDLETPVDSQVDISHITPEHIHHTSKKFIGIIHQIPPQYSAIKKNGVRLYKHARNGDTIPLEPREIQIKTLEITNITLPEVSFKVVCSKGTYIRSLVRDIGQTLGVGAYMSALKRTRIGELQLFQAHALPQFLEGIKLQHASL